MDKNLISLQKHLSDVAKNFIPFEEFDFDLLWEFQSTDETYFFLFAFISHDHMKAVRFQSDSHLDVAKMLIWGENPNIVELKWLRSKVNQIEIGEP